MGCQNKYKRYKPGLACYTLCICTNSRRPGLYSVLLWGNGSGNPSHHYHCHLVEIRLQFDLFMREALCNTYNKLVFHFVYVTAS